MNIQKAASGLHSKFPKARDLMVSAATIVAVICMTFDALQADTKWTPSVDLTGTYNDNIQFTRTDPVDDYVYTLQPKLKVDYQQELTAIEAAGDVTIRRYQDSDQMNDELYHFELNGKSNLTERSRLRGSYEFIKDTTLDSELYEIGRIYTREDRISHEAKLAPSYNLNERMSIGLSGRYRYVSYDSNLFNDYSDKSIYLPLSWRLATQIDTVYISPGYAYRESDLHHSKSYNLRIGWNHESTERLNLRFYIGARYTEYDNLATGDSENNWGGLGSLQLNYDFETGALKLDFRHDLQNTAAGNQVNLTRLIARLRWYFTERVGTELIGRYYYTKNEGEDTNDSQQFYQGEVSLFYHFTENHIVFIAYQYSQDHLEDNIQEEPRAEQNMIWAGVSLNFPM